MAKRRAPIKDWHLWTEVRRSITPLRATDLVPAEPEPLPIPEAIAPRSAPPKFSRGGWAGPSLPPYIPPTDRQKSEADRSLEPRVRRRVMRGQIGIDGTLDLHGMRQDQAHKALRRFIIARSGRGDRTVLIITGKGLKKLDGDAARIVERGVLRAMLPIWLSEPMLAELIAGWDQAAQGHGGEGAFYVRLKAVAP
jgi:DNA-nicking Smr family endonuclease